MCSIILMYSSGRRYQLHLISLSSLPYMRAFHWREDACLSMVDMFTQLKDTDVRSNALFHQLSRCPFISK